MPTLRPAISARSHQMTSSVCVHNLADITDATYRSAVTRARAQGRPITLCYLMDRLLRTRAGRNTVLMPGAGSGILKTWKAAGTQTAAIAWRWTCIT
jgi:hypothetical protein